MSYPHAPLLIGLAGTIVLADSAPSQTPGPAQFMSQSLGVVVFPSKGQSADKQRSDEAECFMWAKDYTGFDPLAAPALPTASGTASTAQQPAGDPGQGAAVRGAAGGAAAGAAIGAVAGNAGKGAAVGATAGALSGAAARQRSAAAAQQQQVQQAAAERQAENEHAQKRAGYNRAFGACLDGKGYTVK